MFTKFFSYIYNRNISKKFIYMQNIINKINSLENYFINFSDNDLKNNTFKYKDYLLSGKNINNILHFVFANIKEAIKRVFNIRLFNVQLLGAIILNDGNIAEMKTGEGKTITSTLPAYLNSLYGKGVHMVTVNEYLAKRDAIYSSKLFNFLGLTVGLNLPNMSLIDKKKSYLCDITYSTNNEYVFDYLRDKMSLNKDEIVQRKYLNFAILDEVDSILIDESRNPLIISDYNNLNNNIFFKINKIIPYLDINYNNKLINGDFIIDYKSKNIFLTEKGIDKIENLLIKFNIIKNKNFSYNIDNINIIDCVILLLKAYYLFKKNIDYLVKNNNVIIIDEFTGRMVDDRRWSNGLHQAIEVKENVSVKNDNKILSSITYQNYFRLYEKLSGMSGTAISESLEFSTIYKLNTYLVPTNKPIIRNDLTDLIYLDEDSKIKSIIKDIKIRHMKKQPILLGTVSIDKSEFISSELKKIGIKHKILNAKYHKFEAKIISKAGKLGSVTIATNMAGRGTDIVLGGNYLDKINLLDNIKDIKYFKKKWIFNNFLVKKLGGLHIIGSERHESRRIDDQLRGRSGRQGDPGSSRFYISLDDSLMSIFIPNNVINFMKNINLNKNESIEHPWINKSIENAQRKIENRNFEIRKHLLEYDNIINDQRKIIYFNRDKILFSKNLNSKIEKIIYKIINDKFKIFNQNNYLLSYNKIKNIIYKYFNYNLKIFYFKQKIYYNFKKLIINNLIKLYYEKQNKLGINLFMNLQKDIILKTLDFYWREYLYYINNLRDYIHLRSYAQKDPLQEYKLESFKIFNKMLNNFYIEIIKILFLLPNNIKKLSEFLINLNFSNNYLNF